MTAKPKVFGIGLSRTGTQSLVVALERLGWGTVHYPRGLLAMAAYEAAVDIPVSRRFAYLDLIYPTAKFIYTVRNLEGWQASCRRHFDNQPWRKSPFAEWGAYQRDTGDNDFAVYGSVVYDADLFAAAYQRHDSAVTAHFAGRDNLLVVDIVAMSDEDLWARLCEFLSVPIVAAPFPWENKSDG